MPTGLTLIAVLILVACMVVDIVLIVIAKISKEAGFMFLAILVIMTLAIMGMLGR